LEVALRLRESGGDRAARFGALLEMMLRRRRKDWEWDEERNESVEVERDDFVLRLATGLFAQQGYPLLAPYRDDLQAQFHADLRSLDFAQPEGAASIINQWVAEQTEGMIRGIVSPASLHELTRFVLVNAVYFLAQWKEQFSESSTSPQPFHALSGDDIEVPMMHQTTELGHMRDDRLGFEAVAIPYQAMSMIVILPGTGQFAAVERLIDTDLVERVVSELRIRLIALGLPKFELDWGGELGEALGALGIKRVFDSNEVDLSGISDHPEGLFVSEIVHQARVRVDEYGTEAAAVTAVWLAGLAEMPQEPYPMVVDRPFLFLIRDDLTGAIL
jgi:serpin B